MRIQLEVSNETLNQLNELQESAGITTTKELFNNALSLFQWALNEVQNGRSIASLDETDQTYRVVLSPVLEDAARKARRSMRSASAAAL